MRETAGVRNVKRMNTGASAPRLAHARAIANEKPRLVAARLPAGVRQPHALLVPLHRVHDALELQRRDEALLDGVADARRVRGRRRRHRRERRRLHHRVGVRLAAAHVVRAVRRPRVLRRLLLAAAAVVCRFGGVVRRARRAEGRAGGEVSVGCRGCRRRGCVRGW